MALTFVRAYYTLTLFQCVWCRKNHNSSTYHCSAFTCFRGGLGFPCGFLLCSDLHHFHFLKGQLQIKLWVVLPYNSIECCYSAAAFWSNWAFGETKSVDLCDKRRERETWDHMICRRWLKTLKSQRRGGSAVCSSVQIRVCLCQSFTTLLAAGIRLTLTTILKLNIDQW